MGRDLSEADMSIVLAFAKRTAYGTPMYELHVRQTLTLYTMI
jgi:hypothetical protein